MSQAIWEQGFENLSSMSSTFNLHTSFLSPVLIKFICPFCVFKYILTVSPLLAIKKKFLKDVLFVSCFYLFSTCFFSFSKISSGGVETKSLSTFSRDLPPLSKTTSLFPSSKTLEGHRYSSALASPSVGGAVMSTLTASVVMSVTGILFGTSFGMDGYGDTAFTIDCRRTCGESGLSGSLLWLLAHRPASLPRSATRILCPPSRSHRNCRGPVRCSSFLRRVGAKGGRVTA